MTSSSARSSRLSSAMTTSGSSTTGAKTRAPTGIAAAFPAEYGGKNGTNLGMAIIREHLAGKGLGLHCDLQNEHMIVGNNVGLLLMIEYGTPEQRKEWTEELAAGRRGFAFGITEPTHGSDATYMETRAVRDGQHWVINGEKSWNSGLHAASHDLIFART